MRRSMPRWLLWGVLLFRAMPLAAHEAQTYYETGVRAFTEGKYDEAVTALTQAVILADALAQLPEDYSQVLVLRHLEELSFPEVADRMGRSVNSVKNLWARALARLRRSLGGSS